MNTQEMFANWLVAIRRIGTVDRAMAHFNVDQKTLMPSPNTKIRGHDSQVLSEIHHGMITAPEFVGLTSELATTDELTPQQSACIRSIQREIDRASKTPVTLVGQIEDARVNSVEAWQTAKAERDFSLVEKEFAELIRLKREEARCLTTGPDLYSAFTDQYLPGMTTARALELITGLVTRLQPLVEQTRGKAVPTNILDVPYDSDLIFRLQQNLAARMGLNPKRAVFMRYGHPFCMGFSPFDTRIAMSLSRRGVFEEISNLEHECMHAINDQGFDPDWWYTPMNESPSCAMSESQPKIWETVFGRSKEFWYFYFPILQEYFPQLLGSGFTYMDAYRFVSRVQASHIRIEADPVTYHAHILIRLKTGIALINDGLPISEYPIMWNGLSEELLGIVPPTVDLGCAQDEHEYDGAQGYFLSYSFAEGIGALLAWAMDRQMIGGVYRRIANGDFLSPKNWLNRNIHSRGKLHTTEELVKLVTGSELTFDPLVKLLTERTREVYNL